MGLVSIWWTEQMWSKQQKIFLCYLTCLCFFLFFSRNFNTSSIHNQFPVNEKISTDDTGCDKVGRTHYFEVAGQKIKEREDITLEKLSAHFFPVQP